MEFFTILKTIIMTLVIVGLNIQYVKQVKLIEVDKKLKLTLFTLIADSVYIFINYNYYTEIIH